jgi:uncharacterized membrane protein
MKLSLRVPFVIFVSFFFFLSAVPVLAQDTTEVQATVESAQSVLQPDGTSHLVITARGDDEKSYTIDTFESHPNGIGYALENGDRISIQTIIYPDGTTQSFFGDVWRTQGLWLIAFLFVVVAIAIGRKRGFFAVIGLFLTLGILFRFIYPQILAGVSPVVVTALGCLMILAVNMFLSHGVNRRTALAFLSTAIGLGLAVISGTWFVELLQLSGMGTEDEMQLAAATALQVIPHGVILAGVILGATGVLDDIAITQTETVAELAEADPNLSRKELFTRAMRIGRHHIASTVNTLVLAYAGAATPLLLLVLFYKEDISFVRFLNSEAIVEEIVQTAAGTIALMLTVPVATWVATYGVKKRG